MSEDVNSRSKENGKSTVWQKVGRLVTAAIVLGITAFFLHQAFKLIAFGH